jgi:hypothetical protein
MGMVVSSGPVVIVLETVNFQAGPVQAGVQVTTLLFSCVYPI